MEYEIKPAHRFSLNLKELWEYRELIFFFTWRDIKIKYKQTLLGAAWAILQPFMLMVIFTLFFSKALHIQSGDIPYPVFVYSGLMLWSIFATGLSNAGSSMVNNAHIIKKIYFPRLIIPISAILSSLIDFFMTFIVYIGILFYYHYQSAIPVLLLYLPLALLLTLLATLGFGSLLAALNLKYRDFRYIIPFMLQMLMFLTPVIYPVSIIKSEILQHVLMLNPMAGVIDLVRSALTDTSVNQVEIYYSIVVSLLLFVTGIVYFRKTEHYFADIA
jgi:lipopolysaccharide transport system permease protein